ncbi:2-oxo-4-hydroxy-4-carboxy-5-ureidoimidazoline decarboxylase [Nocardioides sp.]|uniref:2-oxo-4-hydroxy-4-carboxy-5-ureidoimidazoline decarboxylase n=1 Tax=Nocardioides sp. TaxID=35761 RepID=UPI003515ACDD
MGITAFDALPDAEARALLLSCAAVPGWADRLVAGRPYGSTTALLDAAAAGAATWSAADVDAALADHPRIGERPTGTGASAAMSRREQAGVSEADADALARLRAGNAAYEERFGRIYLVRAKGRTTEELLALLDQRLTHDPATEAEVVRGQLAEIALLRLADLIPHPDSPDLSSPDPDSHDPEKQDPA